MVALVEDGGGGGEATSINLHRPPGPPPTSAGRRSVNGDAPARPGEICRDLLERAVAADPEPDAFEAWLHEQCLAAGGSEGGVRAMALSIFEEWRLAHDADAFRDWLARGAPSDDALTE